MMPKDHGLSQLAQNCKQRMALQSEVVLLGKNWAIPLPKVEQGDGLVALCGMLALDFLLATSILQLSRAPHLVAANNTKM